MSITANFIRREIAKQSYEISIHADRERLAEELTVDHLESALLHCEILEQYPDDPRGVSCLAIGFVSPRVPVHAVCGKNRSGHLILVTVYIPAMPKWRDPYMRNRQMGGFQ